MRSPSDQAKPRGRWKKKRRKAPSAEALHKPTIFYSRMIKVARLAHDKSLTIRTALVYDGRLSPSVEADRFFDFVIPAEKLFG